MLKHVMLLLVILCTSVFGQIDDQIELFDEKNQAMLEERINVQKKALGIEYIIYTVDDSSKINREQFKDLKSSVIVIMEKKPGKNLVTELIITNDIELFEYNDKVNSLLDELEGLVSAEKYTDYTYEMIANISDLVTLIRLDENKEVTEEIEEESGFSGYLMVFIKAVVVVVILLIFYLIFVLMKGKANKRRCDSCLINMIIEKEEETDKGREKTFKCPQCGKRKKIIFRKKG